MEFMYGNTIQSVLSSESSGYKIVPDEKHYSAEEIKSFNQRLGDELCHLMHLWYLADYLLMPRLQNHVLAHLEIAQLRFGRLPSPKEVWKAGGKDISNFLFRWAVDSFVQFCKIKDERKEWNDAPREVLLEMLIASQELNGKERPSWFEYCVMDERDCKIEREE